MALGQLPADVPEFLEVGVARALGGLNPERGVAPLPLAAGDREPSLRLLWKGEEGAGVGQGNVDAGLSSPWSATTAKP
jgi:hypothetical protein